MSTRRVARCAHHIPARGRARPGAPTARRQRSHLLHLEEEIRPPGSERPARQLRSLEDENARLKRVVADLSLEQTALTEGLRKKSEAHTAPRAGRVGADHLAVSCVRACHLAQCSRTARYRRPPGTVTRSFLHRKVANLTFCCCTQEIGVIATTGLVTRNAPFEKSSQHRCVGGAHNT